MARLVCANPQCGKAFERIATEARRAERHFCSQPCYYAVVDRTALGKAGGAIAWQFLDPERARERARKGGLARAQKQTPEQLRAIALKGVEARKAQGAAGIKKAMFARRFGKRFWLGVPLGKDKND